MGAPFTFTAGGRSWGHSTRCKLDGSEPTDNDLDAGAAYWRPACDVSTAEVEEFAGRVFPSTDRRSVWFIPDDRVEPQEIPDMTDADGIPTRRA